MQVRNMAWIMVCYCGLPFVGIAQSSNLHLEYPPNGVAGRPVLEFRARSTGVGVEMQGAKAVVTADTGHAYVALGRQLESGKTVFYATAGFTPKDESLKVVLNTPGEVEVGQDDLTDPADISFQVKITAEQEKAVRFILKNWNEKEYKVLSQNCSSLIKSIGKTLGLEVGDPKSVVTPYSIVQLLKNENDPDRPLRQAVIDGKRAEEIHRGNAAVVKQTFEHIKAQREELQQKRDSIDRFNNGMGTPGSGGFGVPMNGGRNDNPFPADTTLQYTYPWPSPSK
jgi:hypothetical protein